MTDGMYTMMWPKFLSGFLLLVLAIAVAVAALRWLGRGNAPMAAGREKPLELLKRRYAKGEIDKLEFEKIRKDIE